MITLYSLRLGGEREGKSSGFKGLGVAETGERQAIDFPDQLQAERAVCVYVCLHVCMYVRVCV